MILPEYAVAAPLFLSAGLIPLILRADTVIQQESLHPLDTNDPAGWNRSREWLLGAPIEYMHRLSSSSPSSTSYVAEHASGQWRTLRRHGSVQSVTLMQPASEEDKDTLVPFHSSVGNEYLKVMASAYAAFGDVDKDERDDATKKNSLPKQHHDLSNGSQSDSILHLGLGGGTLPMLLGEPCKAIELDEDAVDLAIEFCGLDPEMVAITRGADALHHQKLAPGPHSCIFVDVFGEDNNVPLPFVEEGFVRSLWESLDNGGLVIANFHCNGGGARNAEDVRLQQAISTYSRVFNKHRNHGMGSSLVRIPSRYQGNMILCARKGDPGDPHNSPFSLENLNIERARRVASARGWRFDPGARLQKVQGFPF